MPKTITNEGLEEYMCNVKVLGIADRLRNRYTIQLRVH
jgi:hypothetical protein